MIQATFTRTLTIYVVRFCFNLHVIWLFYVACLCAGFFALNTAPLFGSFAVDAGPRCTPPCASGSWSNCWRFSRRWCQTWWHGTIWPVCVVRSFRAIGFFWPEQILFCFSRFTKAASGRGRSRSPLLSRKKSGVFEARSSDLASQWVMSAVISFNSCQVWQFGWRVG